MKKVNLILFVLFALCFCISSTPAEAAAKGPSGEELFKTHCAVCHPDGGNIVNPQFTLHKEDRDEHGIKRIADVIKKMRNPGPGMTKFDKATIPDKDARKIAEYIFKTFK